MGQELFDRVAVLTVGSIRVERLRLSFSVTKDAKPQPNKATIKVYNLSPDHRAYLSELSASGVDTQLEAGYKAGTSVIYRGSLRRVFTMRENKTDLVTTLETSDGIKQVQESRVSISVQKGATNKDVLAKVARAVGVLDGNLSDALSKLGGASVFMNGGAFYGSAVDEMTRLCRSLDLTWSIQDGKLQVLARGAAVEGVAIRLSKETGLIGEPSIDPKGKLQGTMLIQPDVFPGRIVKLEGERVKGNFKLEQTTHSGDTRSTGPWQVAFQAETY